MANIVAQMQVLISAQTKGLNTALAQSQSALKSFEGAIKTTNTALTAFGVGIGLAAVSKIAGDIIEVTAQFERFAAILSNTLGSDSAAQAALDEIRVFAQETPFEVSEITAAYVRWANQGLNPTIDKMTKLGDVASSLGAGFEQTAEAFKDLLVGQTKRIEEIGISATQSGGKIQLSFKGVNLEIAKTAEGVDQALNVFSQLQGVLGTSAQVSETLGGKISNLKDAYSNLLLTVGNANGSVLKDSVDLFINIANAAGFLVKTLTTTDTWLGQIAVTFTQSLLAPTKVLVALINGLDKTNEKLAEQKKFLDAVKTTTDAAFASGNIDAYTKAIGEGALQTAVLLEIEKRRVDQAAADKAANLAKIETLNTLQAKLKELNEQFEDTDKTDKASLRNTANKIIATTAQIAKLEELRKKQKEVNELSAFGKSIIDKEAIGIGITGTEFKLPGIGDQPDMSDIFPTTIPVPDIEPAMAALQTYTEAQQAAGVAAVESSDQAILAFDQQVQAQQRVADMAQHVGAVFGDTVGDVLSGQKTLLQGIKSVTAQLLPLFVKTALAGTITGAAKTTAPPPVILALAAAGVAGVLAMFSSIGVRGSGGGGGGLGAQKQITSATVRPTESFAESIKFEGKFRLEGPDLVATVGTNGRVNGRLGG